MHSDYPLVQISDSTHSAIHAYFDLCPESPDGAHVVYFRWQDTPKVGQVMVANRDGAHRRVLDDVENGGTHGGVRQQWVDNDHTAFFVQDSGEPATRVVALTGGARTLPGAIRMYSPVNGQGLTSSNEGRTVKQNEEASVYRMDFESGTLRLLFTRDDVIARHPLLTPEDDITQLMFKHTKWAPDGTRFFVVFHNEPYISAGGTGRRIKSIFIADADGSHLRYLTEFGHHPMWGGNSRFVYSFSPSPGGQSLTRYPLDGGSDVLLGGIAGVHASLSPDGKWVVSDVFHWPEPGQGAIVLYDVATGERRTLATFRLHDATNATGTHPHPVWSRDGRRVYFNSDDTGTPALYAVDIPA